MLYSTLPKGTKDPQELGDLWGGGEDIFCNPFKRSMLETIKKKCCFCQDTDFNRKRDTHIRASLLKTESLQVYSGLFSIGYMVRLWANLPLLLLQL